MPSKFYTSITEDGCNQFKLNPNVNPLTGRRITSIETKYTMFLACKNKFGHAIPDEFLRQRKNAKNRARQDDWEWALDEEYMKYVYAFKWGERWHPSGVGHGEKISRVRAAREEAEYMDAKWKEDNARYDARHRQAPPPPPPPRQPRGQAPPPRNVSVNMSQEAESAAKRLQYCKKLSALAVSEKDNVKFVNLGMALARRYGYATGDGQGRIHLRKAMQLVCHPDKYVNTLTPSKHAKVTEYIQIINNRLDKLK